MTHFLSFQISKIVLNKQNIAAIEKDMDRWLKVCTLFKIFNDNFFVLFISKYCLTGLLPILFVIQISNNTTEKYSRFFFSQSIFPPLSHSFSASQWKLQNILHEINFLKFTCFVLLYIFEEIGRISNSIIFCLCYAFNGLQ